MGSKLIKTGGIKEITDDQLLEFLSEDYWKIDRRIAKKVGLTSALWLSHIINKYAYFKKNNMLDKEGFFYDIQAYIEKETTLTPIQQTGIVRKLQEHKIIQVRKKGIPAKNYYKINITNLINIATSGNVSLSLVTIKDNLNNNKNIIIKKDKDFSSKEEKYDFLKSQPSQLSLRRPAINLTPMKLKNRPTRDSAPEPVQKGLLSYGAASAVAHTIIDHWNHLITTPTHKLNSKGIQKMLFLLDSPKGLIDKYGEEAIKRTMDEFSEMQQNAKIYEVSSKKVSIGDFFSGNGYIGNRRWRRGESLEYEPWFTKLIVPGSYKQYLKREDPNLVLTDKIKEQYQRHVLHEEVEFTPKQESQFREAARRLKDYMGKGHRLEGYVDGADAGDYIRMVFEALEGEFKGVVQIGNLCSKYTWDNVFPRFLTKHYESSQFY